MLKARKLTWKEKQRKQHVTAIDIMSDLAQRSKAD
jgi:hypothetical protein